MSMFFIRANLLQELLADDECFKESNKAKTQAEVQHILVKYAEKHRFKIGSVEC